MSNNGMMYLEFFIGVFSYVLSTYILSILYTYSGVEKDEIKGISSYWHLVLAGMFSFAAADYLQISGAFGYMMLIIFTMAITVAVSVYNKLGYISKGPILSVIVFALILDVDLWLNGYSYIFLLYGFIQAAVCFVFLSYLNKFLKSKKDIVLLNTSEIALLSAVLLYLPIIQFIVSYALVSIFVLFCEIIVFLRKIFKDKHKETYKIKRSTVFMASCFICVLSIKTIIFAM